MAYEFPPAHAHGELEQVFDDVFMVVGTVRVTKPPLRFSRNMVVLRHGSSLTLVNSVRLNEAGLAKLDALGKVEHVIRLCGFHGMDDPFYADRYGAKVWAVEGHRYVRGLPPKSGASTYFEADEFMTESTSLPIPGAKLFVFDTAKPKEGMLLLEREGGILISGDPLQNWGPWPDRYFNFLGRVMMRVMGFIKPHALGPGWLKGSGVDANEFKRLFELEFDHVLPAHGGLVIGGAKQKFQPAVDALTKG